jgi:hypothetical protein
LQRVMQKCGASSRRIASAAPTKSTRRGTGPREPERPSRLETSRVVAPS